VTIDEVCTSSLLDYKRRAEGTEYGVAVLAEGLIEAMGEKGLLEPIKGPRSNDTQDQA